MLSTRLRAFLFTSPGVRRFLFAAAPAFRQLVIDLRLEGKDPRTLHQDMAEDFRLVGPEDQAEIGLWINQLVGELEKNPKAGN